MTKRKIIHAIWVLTSICVIFKCDAIAFNLNAESKIETHLLREKYFVNTIGMEFVHIPAGSFLMGSPSTEIDRNPGEDLRFVKIKKPFLFGTYEVTQAQWQKVMGNSPSYFKGNHLPVEQVSWIEVNEFVNKLNAIEKSNRYRLPTEAEWEYACRSETTSPFYSGDCLSTNEANYNGNYPYSGCIKGEYFGRTLPVGSFLPNAFGLYDMHGNVMEWCIDRCDKSSDTPHPPNSTVSPTTGIHRIIRGGGWYLPAYLCRSAHRDTYRQDFGCDAIGFRVLMMIH